MPYFNDRTTLWYDSPAEDWNCALPVGNGRIGGMIFGQPKHEKIYLYSSELVDSADCVFSVNGDSMEPDFRDGDMVLVQRFPDCPRLSEGEIGAFIVGNETYVKEYREDGLHSLNAKYKPMRFSDDESVFFIGKVVGVLDPDDIASDEDVNRYFSLHRPN